MMFDYAFAAQRAGISSDKLDCPVSIMRPEFPDDEAMADLHILRAILAVERNEASLEAILRQRALID